MPRKAKKTEKPPLLFLERPLCGARLQNVPEVRAAVIPREFFTETHTPNSAALNSWVSPQFDRSAAAVPPVKRVRRRCQSAASILDSCSQLSRENRVCKFPSLSFQTRPRDQSHQPKNTCPKKAAQCAVVSNVGNQPQGSCQNKRTASSAKYSDTPKRQSASNKKKISETFSDAQSRCLDQLPSIQETESCGIPADGTATPPSMDFSAAEVSSVGPPPDVDTPEGIQKRGSCLSSPTIHLLLAQPCTPSCNRPPDILVADTPERDYGLKVTWRRRKGLMLLLKERGHLSESDAQIHS